jgi:hypothetical protein
VTVVPSLHGASHASDGNDPIPGVGGGGLLSGAFFTFDGSGPAGDGYQVVFAADEGLPTIPGVVVNAEDDTLIDLPVGNYLLQWSVSATLDPTTPGEVDIDCGDTSRFAAEISPTSNGTLRMSGSGVQRVSGGPATLPMYVYADAALSNVTVYLTILKF